MAGQHLRLVRCLLVAIGLPLLFGSSCGQTGDSGNVEADARFRGLFGPALTEGLVITTNRATYHTDDTIDFWVQDRTDQDLWFEDQSFGVQAFAYDEVAGEWVEIDLGFVESIPTPIAVKPGLAQFPGIVPVEYIDASAVGKIRLVIKGHTDLENPERDQVYIGYTDIEIAR